LSWYDPNATWNGGIGATTQRIRPKQDSKADGLEKTVAWTPRTLKTELGWKRCGWNKVQGLNCEISGSLGGFLQDSRDLDIIMCETRRSNM
jgi:hypothetical protein